MRTLFLFLALALGGADVYRWVDADGQPHYSDQPSPGAERVSIEVGRPAAGAGNTSGVARGATDLEDVTSDTPLPYQSLTIASPAQEAVLWNIEGQLDVAAAVQPALQSGHVLQFYLDGQMSPAEPGETRTRFPGVSRGEHMLRVEVVDPSGRSLVSSPMIRFFVRQTTTANQAVASPSPSPPVPTPRPRPRP